MVLAVSQTATKTIMCREWVQRTHRLSGRTLFEPVAVREQLTACFTRYRRYNRSSSTRLRAMTVHQAKNREFDGVVVLWPYTVAGTAEQKRRLLYNAITRAKRW
jgi:superfamily I DNA/RNA helicase